MTSEPTKLQRWLDIISYLASRHTPASTDDLWRNVPAYAGGIDAEDREKQTVRRMFERDKKELIAFGIPIETVTYTINYGNESVDGYRLGRKDFHLPYLQLIREVEGGLEGDPAPGVRSTPRGTATFELSESEAGAALEGLRELASLPAFPLSAAARSAFRKLAFDLDSVVEETAPVYYAVDPETEAAAEHLTRLSDAVRRRKQVTFRYWSISTNSEEDRTVHPLGLLFQHGRWYLVAWDPARADHRMFRLGRISDVRVNRKTPGTPDFEVDDGFSLERFAGRRAWELGAEDVEPLDAVVRFAFPRSLWAERNGHGELIEEADAGDQRRRFAVYRPEPFVRWVLSMAGDAVVEAPDALRREFEMLSRRVAELHGEGEER